MAEIADLQRWVDGFLREPPGGGSADGLPPSADGQVWPFSPFDGVHMARVADVTQTFVRAAAAAPGADGLEAVQQAAEALVAGGENDALVRRALAIFITHDENGRLLTVPPLRERAPEWVTPSREKTGPELQVVSDQDDPEALLDWFREDDALNDHHEHWHLVYRADVGTFSQAREIRRGELFFYMHQQMLARYDTERVTAGLDPVVALDPPLAPPFNASLGVGYDAGATGYANRPSGLNLKDASPQAMAILAQWWRRLDQAARTQKLHNGEDGVVAGVNRFADVLGSAAEANADSREPAHYGDVSTNGGYHNAGHGHDQPGHRDARPDLLPLAQAHRRPPRDLPEHPHPGTARR
jgi:hypothetical protein